MLYETLVVGTRWLIRSANIQASADGVELGKGSVALMLGLTLVLGVGIFFLLPLFIAAMTTSSVQPGLGRSTWSRASSGWRSSSATSR